MEKLNVAFLGGRILGYKTLSILKKYNDAVNVPIVIAHKKDGEFGSDWNPPILPLARKLGFKTYEPTKMSQKNIIEIFKKEKINIILNSFCNRIIPKQILDIPEMGTINFHYGKLPKYKGRFIVSHMIINGEKKAYVTAHYMTEEIDAGDVIYEEPVEIKDDDTAKDLYFRCTVASEKMFEKTILNLIRGINLPKKPQKGKGNYYRFEEPNNCEVDFSWSRDKIDRFIRGVTFKPISYAKLKIGNKKFKIVEDES